ARRDVGGAERGLARRTVGGGFWGGGFPRPHRPRGHSRGEPEARYPCPSHGSAPRAYTGSGAVCSGAGAKRKSGRVIPANKRGAVTSAKRRVWGRLDAPWP